MMFEKRSFKEKKSKKIKKNKILDRVFNSSICKLAVTAGKHAEFNLPMSYKVDTNNMKVRFPIEQEVLTTW